MKKILTIGRDAQCDICINDSTDVVSRNHAVLEIGKNGKYFITDQSRNGTYVNGMRISQNEKVPVTRNDVISLAHVRELDWAVVPKGTNAMLITGIAVAVAAVIAVVVLLVCLGKSSGSGDGNINISGGGSYMEQPSGGTPVVESPEDDNDATTDEGTTTDEDTPTEKNDDGKVEKAENQKPAKEQKKNETPDKKNTDTVIDAIY